MTVTGLTVEEMAEKLGIKPNAVMQRIHVAGVQPLVNKAIYPLDTLSRISKGRRGRPRKAEPADLPPAPPSG